MHKALNTQNQYNKKHTWKPYPSIHTHVSFMGGINGKLMDSRTQPNYPAGNPQQAIKPSLLGRFSDPHESAVKGIWDDAWIPVPPLGRFFCAAMIIYRNAIYRNSSVTAGRQLWARQIHSRPAKMCIEIAWVRRPSAVGGRRAYYWRQEMRKPLVWGGGGRRSRREAERWGTGIR